MNNTLVIYIHGKGGNAEEAEHYKKLFADCDVAGFDYKAETLWDFKDEFLNWAEKKFGGYEKVIIVANSIGAYFSMNAISQANAETGGEHWFHTEEQMNFLYGWIETALKRTVLI